MKYNNTPLEILNSRNDLFKFQKKASILVRIFNEKSDFFSTNRMIGLFGGWGSGKTTLLRHLAEKVDKELYHPIFFEAWEYEKDDNLALSLSDALASELPESKFKEIGQDFLRISGKLLKGFASGLSVKFPVPRTGLSVGFSPKELLNQDYKEVKELSFQKRLLSFKKEYERIENEILKAKSGESKNKRILVFIDDLDRCESENILSLISAIKLFFTYGKKTIFIFGIDRDAIKSAVLAKYKEAIKSEEYLEKIFDISFNIPICNSYEELFENFFIELDESNEKKNLIRYCSDLFIRIGFNNPRHIKKVLNKYSLLCFLLKNRIVREKSPNIIFHDQYNLEGDIFDTVLSLYLIIIHEYYNEQIEKIYNQESKINLLSQIQSGEEKYVFGNPIELIQKAYSFNLNTFIADDNEMIKIIYFLLSGYSGENIDKIDWMYESDQFINQFSNLAHPVTVKFCLYLFEIKEVVIGIDKPKGGKFSLNDLKIVIENYL